MPDTPNPCIVCGRHQSPPIQMGTGNADYQCFCYADPTNHSIMVSGRTAAEAVQRWNRLNARAQAPLTLGAFLRRIMGR